MTSTFNRYTMTDMIEIPTASYIDFFKSTTGAFSVAECIALVNICKQVPKGLFVELGTHKGKSAIASLYGLPKKGVYYLIEPEFKETQWSFNVMDRIEEAKKMCESKIWVGLCGIYSVEYIPQFYDYSYVFVDSGVHDDLVMVEVKMLEDKMISQGIIAFHDYKNQFTAVERAYQYLLSTGKYEVVPIDWPAILNYVIENNLEEGNNSWHLYPELGHPPNFVGALKRK